MAAARQKAGIWFDQVRFFETNLMQFYVTKKKTENDLHDQLY